MNKIRHVVDYGQGLTSIMGDVGLGKSTLVRFLMDEFIERDDLVVAGILSPTYPTDFAFLYYIKLKLSSNTSLFENGLGRV